MGVSFVTERCVCLVERETVRVDFYTGTDLRRDSDALPAYW